MKRSLLLALAALCTLAACGADNVSACNRWKDAVKCGTNTTAIDSISCSAYANTTCDISAYFDCLSTAYVCVNGSYDTSKLGNASACASKAVCK